MALVFTRLSGTRRLGQIVISGLHGRTKSVTYNISLSSRMASTAAAAGKIDISGIYPPIVTPFNDDETIAYDKLQKNMDKWNKIPFRGIFLYCFYMFTGTGRRTDLYTKATNEQTFYFQICTNFTVHHLTKIYIL